MLIWTPVILMEEFIARRSENVIFNLIIRVISCIICTYLVNKWLFGHSIPYLLDLSGHELIEYIYGEGIFTTLEKMRFIKP